MLAGTDTTRATAETASRQRKTRLEARRGRLCWLGIPVLSAPPRTGLRAQGSGLRAQGSGLKAQGSGLSDRSPVGSDITDIGLRIR
jgi:hypothetical protein